jgi:hypothetical protein
LLNLFITASDGHAVLFYPWSLQRLVFGEGRKDGMVENLRKALIDKAKLIIDDFQLFKVN